MVKENGDEGKIPVDITINASKKTIFGLKRGIFWTILACVVILAAIIGSIIGGISIHKNQADSTLTTDTGKILK